MNLDDCFKKRLLRKERPDKQRAQRSIEVARAKLEQAEKAADNELYDAALVLAYTSMFHAARAILFKDGVVEKSHVCLVEYLREEYARKGRISEGLVINLDRLRIDRHEAIYGLETTVLEEQASRSLKQSREFIETARSLIAKDPRPNSQNSSDSTTSLK